MVKRLMPMKSGRFIRNALNYFFTFMCAFAFCHSFADTNARSASKMDCRRNSETNITINLSTGVYTDKAQVATPLHIDIPANVDDKKYFDCLVRNQLLDKDTAERYLAKQDECRNRTRILKATPSFNGTQIGQAQDSAKNFIACMDAEIGVEVLEPTN